jgi:hypothetical protein
MVAIARTMMEGQITVPRGQAAGVVRVVRYLNREKDMVDIMTEFSRRVRRRERKRRRRIRFLYV